MFVKVFDYSYVYDENLSNDQKMDFPDRFSYPWGRFIL
jgi:hypothetical protein